MVALVKLQVVVLSLGIVVMHPYAAYAYLEIKFALYTEMMVVIMALENAHSRVWSRIWLECDSCLVIDAFTNHSIIPWVLTSDAKVVLKIFLICSTHIS